MHSEPAGSLGRGTAGVVGPWLSGADRGSSVVQVRPQGTALLERGMWKGADQSPGSRRET